MTPELNLFDNYHLHAKINQKKHLLRKQINEDRDNCIKEIRVFCNTKIDLIQDDVNLFMEMINNKCRFLDLSDNFEYIEKKPHVVKTIHRGVHFINSFKTEFCHYFT